MLCFKCLDEIKNGNIEEVKNLRSQCEVYKNNQCEYMKLNDSFSENIQDTNIRLFPERFLKYVCKYTLIVLSILVLSITLLNRNSNINNSNNNSSSMLSSNISIIDKVSKYDDTHKIEAFLEVSKEYNFFLKVIA